MRSSLGIVSLVLLGALAAGCGSDPGGDTPDDQTDATMTAEPTGTAPAPESTGHEAPAPGGNGGEPRLDLVGAPIGDGGDEPSLSAPDDYNLICQQVQWLGEGDGAGLGAGVSFSVVRIDVTGGSKAGASCAGPACDGFTFANPGDACYQAIRLGASAGAMAVYGQVRCSAPQSACAAFQKALKRATIPVDEGQPEVTPSAEATPSPEETGDPLPTATG